MDFQNFEARCKTEGGSDEENLQKCWEELIKGEANSSSEEGIYPPVNFIYNEDDNNDDDDEDFEKTDKIVQSFFKKSKASLVNKDLVNVYDDDEEHDEDLDDLDISEKYRNETLKLSNHKSHAPKTFLSIQEKYNGLDIKRSLTSHFQDGETATSIKSTTNLHNGTITMYSYMPQSMPLQSPTNSSVFLRNNTSFSHSIATPTNKGGLYTPQASTHRNSFTPSNFPQNPPSKMSGIGMNSPNNSHTTLAKSNTTATLQPQKSFGPGSSFKRDLTIITQHPYEKKSPIKADMPISGSFARSTEGGYNVEPTRQSMDDPIYFQASNLQSPRYKFLGGLNQQSQGNQLFEIQDEVLLDPPKLYNKESMSSKMFNEKEFREFSIAEAGKMEQQMKKLMKYTINKQNLLVKGKTSIPSTNEEDIVTNESPVDVSPGKNRKVKHQRMKSLDLLNKKGTT